MDLFSIDSNAITLQDEPPLKPPVAVDQDMEVESSPSLEYSASDAPSHTVHGTTTQPLISTSNIISPTSLPDRRISPEEHRRRHPDPPENDATIVTDDGSLCSIDDDGSSHYFPELNSSWNDQVQEASVGYCNDSAWKRCLADCAPASLKDLVSPMRHEEYECYEANEIVDRRDKWLDRALCGRGCEDGGNGSELHRASPAFSNDWDFDNAEDEGHKVDSAQDFVVLPR
jgi:hypothetical protein